MPRLLILCEYPTLLGGERSMLATLPTVAAAGFDVVVAAPPDGPLATALVERGVSHVAWRTHDPAGERFPLDRLAGRFGRASCDRRSPTCCTPIAFPLPAFLVRWPWNAACAASAICATSSN